MASELASTEIQWSSDDDVPIELPEGEAEWKAKYANARRGSNDIHPLFMDEDDMPANPLDDPDLAALSDLVYEGEPHEVAENFKHRGNQQFKEGAKMKRGYYNAIRSYTEALHAGSPDPVANAVYRVNRAAANLALGNNGRVIHDCRKAIELDSANVKAYYRGAVAANDLRRTKVALKFARAGLQIDPENKALEKQVRAAEKYDASVRVAAERQAKFDAEKRDTQVAYVQQIFPELVRRGIRLGKPLFTTQEAYPTKVTLDDSGILHWPVMFLYEEHQQTDFIRDVAEGDTLGDHLAYMFPPSGEPPVWDKENKYVCDALELYVELGITEPLPAFVPQGQTPPKVPRRLLRVRPSTPLIKLLSYKDYVVPHFPAIHVVVKPSKFRDAFLQRHAEE